MRNLVWTGVRFSAPPPVSLHGSWLCCEPFYFSYSKYARRIGARKNSFAPFALKTIHRIVFTVHFQCTAARTPAPPPEKSCRSRNGPAFLYIQVSCGESNSACIARVTKRAGGAFRRARAQRANASKPRGCAQHIRWFDSPRLHQ